MPLLDNQNSEFKTQLHENNVLDLTQNFYPGNAERQVLESNRERKDSNHERQKVKSIEKKKKKKNESISKHFIGNHYNTTDPRHKLLRTLLVGIPLENVFRCKENNKN